MTKRSGTRGVGVLLALFVVLSGLFVLTGVASAAECRPDPYTGNDNCPPEVEADVLSRGETTTDDGSGETLPFTGADVTLFVITGAALVATGVFVVRRTRAAKSEAA